MLPLTKLQSYSDFFPQTVEIIGKSGSEIGWFVGETTGRGRW